MIRERPRGDDGRPGMQVLLLPTIGEGKAMLGRFDRRHVVRLLKELDRRDPKRKLFGSNGHRYRLRLPLPGSAIEACEARHGIVFPEDYRHFITAIGDGGAGPSYGVFPFGQHDGLHDLDAWEGGHLVGDLSQPFPHATAWNLPASFWDGGPDFFPETETEMQHKLMEAWDRELEEKYWDPSLMNGAIPICHLGCARRQWLIVNGPQRGYVWGDDRADSNGLYPIEDGSGEQMTFSGWYLSWLHQALQTVGLAPPGEPRK